MFPLALVDEGFGIALVIGVREQKWHQIGEGLDRLDAGFLCSLVQHGNLFAPLRKAFARCFEL